MRLTLDQLEHTAEPHRLALRAEEEFRKAKLPASEGSTMQIGTALSLAKDLLDNILQQAPQDNW